MTASTNFFFAFFFEPLKKSRAATIPLVFQRFHLLSKFCLVRWFSQSIFVQVTFTLTINTLEDIFLGGVFFCFSVSQLCQQLIEFLLITLFQMTNTIQLLYISETFAFNPLKMASSMSTPIFWSPGITCWSSSANLLNVFTSSVKWNRVGPRKTRRFSSCVSLSAFGSYNKSLWPTCYID